MEYDPQGVEDLVEIRVLGGALRGYDATWGNMVESNVRRRVETIRLRAPDGDPKKLSGAVREQLKKLETLGDELADVARGQRPVPAKRGRSGDFVGKSGDDVAHALEKKWNELEIALEGVEREARVRHEMRAEGGTSLGETGEEMIKGLGIPRSGPGKPPSPDIGREIGGKLILAEGKGGGDVKHALDQFESALKGVTAAKYPKDKIEFRAYVRPAAFEEMTRTQMIDGMRARQVSRR